jgi:hypothetical protein
MVITAVSRRQRLLETVHFRSRSLALGVIKRTEIVGEQRAEIIKRDRSIF